MKKFLFLFFMFMVAGSTAILSQYKILLSENFTDNKAGWPLRRDSSFLVDINNGSLHLQKFKKNFDDRGCLWYTREVDGLNTLQDFSITIYAKFISGGDIMDMFDIQWGVRDKVVSSTATSIYQLNFLLKGDVKLDYFNKQWNYSLRTKAKEIMDKNLYRPDQFNKYEIVQKGGFIILNINDKQYFKQFATPIAGNSIGFQGCLKSEWEIDKIVVKQAKSKSKEKGHTVVLPAVVDSISINNKPTEQALKVYPNPFVNEFTVFLSANKAATAKIELIDMKGNLIMEYDRKLEAGEHTIRLFADVPAGTYIIKSTIDNKAATAKLVKL